MKIFKGAAEMPGTGKNEMDAKLMPRLDKCPICQGMAEIKHSFAASLRDVLIDSVWVQCLSCGLQTEKNYYDSGSSAKYRMEQVAIEAWNKRQKEDITEEQAIDKLRETGWLQKHDEDLESIVHCKDCIHRPIDGEAIAGVDVEFPQDQYPCPYNRPNPQDNWRPPSYYFCFRGERK